jgi:hypothetical protein
MTSIVLPGTESASIVRGVLETRGTARLRVRGDCMAPSVRHGESVTLVSAALRPPRWGDIVLVACPDGIRLHRLVWSGPYRVLTKADRSGYFDPAGNPGAILATLVDTDGACSGKGFRRRPQTLRSLVVGAFNALRIRLRSFAETG